MLVMVLVGMVGAFFVFRDDLSSWSGGTFGMFSSVDNLDTRRIEATAEVQGKKIDVDLSDFASLLREVRMVPTNERLLSFLNDAVCEVAPREASSVTLKYLKLQIDENVVTPVEQWRMSVDC